MPSNPEPRGPDTNSGKSKEKPIPALIPSAVELEDGHKASPVEAGDPFSPEQAHKPISLEQSLIPKHDSVRQFPRAGKGGKRHELLQERIKEAGMAKGFRSEIEGGTQRQNEGVDVHLIRDDLKIACEVSVTTSVDQEFGNILKCLRERFDVVAFISADQARRTKMAAEVDAYFGPVDRAKIRYISPDEFFAYLESIPDLKPHPASALSKTIQGWRVKRKFSPLTPEERAAKEKAAFDLLSQEMKSPPQL